MSAVTTHLVPSFMMIARLMTSQTWNVSFSLSAKSLHRTRPSIFVLLEGKNISNSASNFTLAVQDDLWFTAEDRQSSRLHTWAWTLCIQFPDSKDYVRFIKESRCYFAMQVLDRKLITTQARQVLFHNINNGYGCNALCSSYPLETKTRGRYIPGRMGL